MRPFLFVLIVLFSTVASLTLAGEFPDNVATWIQHWGEETPVGTGKLEPIPAASPTMSHPYFAEKYLEGDAWAAWAITYNRSQGIGSGSYTNQLIQGRTTQIKRQAGQTTIITTPNRYRRVYTGQPMTIYNPYAKQTNQ
jgi:hypothetical protein